MIFVHILLKEIKNFTNKSDSNIIQLANGLLIYKIYGWLSRQNINIISLLKKIITNQLCIRFVFINAKNYSIMRKKFTVLSENIVLKIIPEKKSLLNQSFVDMFHCESFKIFENTVKKTIGKKGTQVNTVLFTQKIWNKKKKWKISNNW